MCHVRHTLALICAKNHLLIFNSFLDIWENVEWPRFFGPPCISSCEWQHGCCVDTVTTWSMATRCWQWLMRLPSSSAGASCISTLPPTPSLPSHAQRSSADTAELPNQLSLPVCFHHMADLVNTQPGWIQVGAFLLRKIWGGGGRGVVSSGTPYNFLSKNRIVDHVCTVLILGRILRGWDPTIDDWLIWLTYVNHSWSLHVCIAYWLFCGNQGCCGAGMHHPAFFSDGTRSPNCFTTIHVKRILFCGSFCSWQCTEYKYGLKFK